MQRHLGFRCEHDHPAALCALVAAGYVTIDDIGGALLVLIREQQLASRRQHDIGIEQRREGLDRRYLAEGTAGQTRMRAPVISSDGELAAG